MCRSSFLNCVSKRKSPWHCDERQEKVSHHFSGVQTSHCWLLPGTFLQHALPWLSATYSDGNHILQQDGTPVHTSPFPFCVHGGEHGHALVKGGWLLHLSNLNLLHYGIWSIMQTKVNATAPPQMDSLRRITQQEWGHWSEAIVWRTGCAFGLHLEKVITVDGSFIN